MKFQHPISIAPMMDYTDRHFRYFVRLITKHALLYSEMVTTQAILNGDRNRLLGFHPFEKPLVLQLGGSDPQALAICARIGEDFGYDEINLNVGCPSSRVQEGSFGACLMKEPSLVADCIHMMQQAVSIPVTVKTRIGVDEYDHYEYLTDFINILHQAGCKTFIIHARKAWLKGLSPKENRSIPPLNYACVYQLKRDFPQLNIILNGGLTNIEMMDTALKQVDGVMIGRQAYSHPYFLSVVDQLFYHDNKPPRSRLEVLQSLFPYIEEQLMAGVRLSAMTRHLIGLVHGLKHARTIRRTLSDPIRLKSNGLDFMLNLIEEFGQRVAE